jgi:hypothetical protein
MSNSLSRESDKPYHLKIQDFVKEPTKLVENTIQTTQT